ncbi:MAG: phosphatase PAP2 family protein [Acidobacteria bacterium]|nr:phosphatase PAP2 family protein [Acidobacteriota bacterium]
MVVWRRATFTDRMHFVYSGGLGLLILVLRHRVPGWDVLLPLHGAMLVLLAALVLNARRLPTAHAWYPLAMPLLLFHEVAHLSFLFANDWRDHYVLAFEAWLFPEPPTVWLGRHATLLATEVLQIGYLSYYGMLVVVATVLYRRNDPAPFAGVMAGTVLAYMLCYAIFIAFPTEGPAHTLRHLHTEPLPGGPLYGAVRFLQQGGVHGNAFPSAHVAGAMVPLLFAWRYAPRLAAWLAPLILLMCGAAVYDRYHNAVDVMAGIPPRRSYSGVRHVRPGGRRALTGLVTALARAPSAAGRPPAA